MCKKNEKDFFYEENFTRNRNLCYMNQTKQTTIHDLFLCFKICICYKKKKKSDLYLRKIQINF